MAHTHLYSSSTMLVGSACSMASAKNSSSDGMNSLFEKQKMHRIQVNIHNMVTIIAS